MLDSTIIENTLARLRQKMKEKCLDYYLIGSSDPHSNENVPEHWNYLVRISGFSGSLGYLLVYSDFAGLWVDSRYHIQAERECPSCIQVFRLGKPTVPPMHEYWENCLKNTSKLLCLGFDGTCFSRNSLNRLLTVTASFNGLIDDQSLKIEELWPEQGHNTIPSYSRPARPQTKVYNYPLQYCGQTRQEKISQVRQIMYQEGYHYYPIPFLDHIAWLLNIRASDIPYQPVAISYLLLGEKSLCWYIEKQRLNTGLANELQKDIPELEIKPYSEFYSDYRTLVTTTRAKFLLSERCNIQLFHLLNLSINETVSSKIVPDSSYLQNAQTNRDIITDLKAIRNNTEQEQLRKIMAIDGAAMVAFHTWLRPINKTENPNIKTEGTTTTEKQLNEYQLGQKLIELRHEFAAEIGRGESFAPIVGFGENSALPHYQATIEKSQVITRTGGWLLIDSGGQYLGGTTDMTRCFSLEPDFAPPRFDLPTLRTELCKLYTLVLKGHLQLQNCRFPQGTLGIQLDSLARSPLWSEKRDYQHGTGHGVGNFLNVHEGPASISSYPLNEPIKAGMLISNEPGYYREGHFGIRIENLLLVQKDPKDPEWLYFEPVTLFPYERELLCLEQLTPHEKISINQYHARCETQILAMEILNSEQKGWLHLRCAPLPIS